MYYRSMMVIIGCTVVFFLSIARNLKNIADSESKSEDESTAVSVPRRMNPNRKCKKGKNVNAKDKYMYIRQSFRSLVSFTKIV